jgi:hypothetical protein
MRIFMILALLASGLLIFGCTYSANYEANGSVNASTGPSANESANMPSVNGTPGPEMNGSEGGMPQPSGGAAPEPSADSGSAMPEPDTGVSGGAQADLSGKTVDDLLELGTASQCTVTLQEDTKTRNLKLYFDGKGSLREEEADTGDAACPSNVVVYTGGSENGTLYTTCPGHTDVLGTKFGTHEQCEWRSMEVSAEWGGPGSAVLGFLTSDTESFDTPYLNSADASAYDCQPWTADPSKFEVRGFVCD